MFKLHKHKSDKSRDKFDFKFSNFQAIQVPKGWDKLFLSLVSSETGKTISKLGKTSVRNGTCRWTETLSESVYIPQDNGDSKELESCLFKFVVAMGSSRSGILGEVTINLADYTSSRTSVPLSLQLKKSNYSTSLQFKVQCLTPKTKYRDAHSKESGGRVDYGSSDHDDMETKSDASDGAFSRSIGSTSSNHLESASTSQAALSRDPSLSASDSRHSFDSVEVSSGKDILSTQDNPSGAANLIGRRDPIDSQNSGPSYSFRASNDNRSNRSSIQSRGPESLSPYGHQREPNSSPFVSSPFSTAGSSKDLLEAAEVTIEELRAETRMWERNAKKLAADVDVLKEELSEQSKSQTTINMELSASNQECNGLKQEIEHLKSLLEESSKKHDIKEDLKLQAGDMNKMQCEMEEEIGFLKESNADLAEQLQKTQESNIELLSILQELEGIVETQKLEIDNLSSKKVVLEDNEKLSPSKDSDLEGNKVGQTKPYLDAQFPESINNINLKLQQWKETEEELESTIRLLEKTVEEKDNEIEMERELRMQSLLDSESECSRTVAMKDEEIKNLEAKLSEVDEGRSKVFEVETGGDTYLAKEIEFLRGKVEDLEKDCNELTQENLELLLKLKEPRTDPLSSDALINSSRGSPDDNSTCLCGGKVQCLELESRCTDLELQLQSFKQKTVHLEDELQKFHAQVEEQQVEVLKLQQQLKECNEKETKAGDPHFLVPNVNSASLFPNNLSHVLTEMCKLLHYFHKLTKTHDTLNFPVDPDSIDGLKLKCEESLTWEEQLSVTLDCLSLMNKFFESECNRYANCTSIKGLAKSDTVISSDLMSKELERKASEMEALKSDDQLRKEEEIRVLREQLSTLENEISSLHDEHRLLEESIESLEREKSTSLEELEKEITTLHSSVESHVSANKVLERLSSELERGKEDLEQQLSDLEKENMQLSERISALEAQLRYLTNEKETCHLELRHSESQTTNLRDEIRRLETEMEAHKLDMKQKLQEMRNRWLEAQEECEYLKKANPKLQATAENLIEECTSLQKFNGELKRHNMELLTRCSVLESQLRDSHGRFSECSEKIEALEMEFTTMLEEVSLKEKSLKSELDSLTIEDREHKEKLMQENVLLNHMYSQKVVEVENLQRELAHLIDQISIADDEHESVSSDAILEVSVLRADKAKLEAALEDLQGKFTVSESNMSTLEAESEAKVQELIGELRDLRQNQQVLMTDHDKLLAVVESYRSNEEKHKSVINGLEMKLKASDYEKLQLAEEISSFKEQLQRSTLLQDEVLALKSSLSDTRFEHERMKASLDLIYGDHEELKIEKDSLVQKISSMEKALLKLEDCQRSKIALEEKILRLEGDLAAREALCAQDAELKFELGRVKRANGELQRKIKHLEEDQKEYLKTAEDLEEQLKQKQDKVKSVSNPSSDLDDESIATVSSSGDDKQLLGVPGVENTDYLSTIQTLENQLAEALEANDMYKAQLRRFLSEEQNNCSDTSESDVRRHGNNLSSLEMELRDLQERYFQMSLKYAEVEAQREDLVMKLKSTNNRKRWFS